MSVPQRRSWRGALSLLVSVAVLVAVGCALRPMPDYEKDPPLSQVEGALAVAGLNGEVKVYRDQWGVPHIFTEDEHDLFVADGFVQAQDRLWEIYLFRAIATGRLAETFGDFGMPGMDVMGMPLSTLGMDKWTRTVGLARLGEAGVAMLEHYQPHLLEQMQWYCDGVNAFVEQNRDRLPLEFQVLYLKPEPITPADIVALDRFLGFMLGANMMDELARHAMIEAIGEDAAWKLMPLHDSLGPTVVPTAMLQNALPQPRPLEPDQSRYPDGLGLSADAATGVANFAQAFRAGLHWHNGLASNNWAAGPKVTTTGTAILCNDPHLPHFTPSIVYVMHLKGAGFDAYGAAFLGQPYVVLGHTPKLAWAATVTNADVQDLFVETVDKKHPGQYLYKGEWRSFVEREEIIKVRPGTLQTGPERRMREVKIKVRHSIHGPIISDAIPGLPGNTPPMALRWTGYEFSRDPRLFENYIESTSVPEMMERIDRQDLKGVEFINEGMTFNDLMRGQNIDDFIRAQKSNVVLSMNWMAADADGNIAYLPGGLVPIRKKGIGAIPAPGESGDYDWAGFIPLMEHPLAINPDRGWMATANNQIVDPNYYPYVFATSYADGYRAWRIEELIEQLKPLDVEDMKRIQNDVYVKRADVYLPLILAAIEQKGGSPKVKRAGQILAAWDRQASIDSAGAAIFYETMSHLAENALADEFSAKDYKKVAGHASLAIEMMLYRGDDEFMDNKRTPGKIEDGQDVIVAALEDGLKWLEKQLGPDLDNWRWGDVHKMKWYHPMGFGPLRDLSTGPLPHPGGDDTVRNASTIGIGSKKYWTFLGPCMRHIIDLGDPNHALFVPDGGQSGQWLSPHYRDLNSMWYNSQYMTAEMRPNQIAQQAESLLVLTP